MGFTASKEPGYPDTHISGRRVKGFAVIIKKTDKMFLQFPCDNIFFYFLTGNIP